MSSRNAVRAASLYISPVNVNVLLGMAHLDHIHTQVRPLRSSRLPTIKRSRDLNFHVPARASSISMLCFFPFSLMWCFRVFLLLHRTTFSVDPDTHIDSLEQAEEIVLEGTSKWSCKIAITGTNCSSTLDSHAMKKRVKTRQLR